MTSSPRVPSVLVALLLAAGCAGSSSSGDSAGREGGDAIFDPRGGGGASGGDAGSSGDGARPTPVSAIAITDLAYFVGDRGPRILVRGVRPLGSSVVLRVALLDAAGQPAVIDLEGDGSTEPSELELEVAAAATESFFEVVESAPGLERTVRAVAVTAHDASGRAGERHLVPLAARPVRRDGEGCDAQGFDACGADAVCTPGIPGGVSRCEPAARARATRCADAPTLDSSAGPATVVGEARGASLWDPPEGCASAERRSRPDALVHLHVPVKTASITLTTASPGTDFDTVLYVLDGCPATSAAALACNDDDAPPTSKVVLRDVEAGDYFVVVDALTREGGSFTLSVTAR